MRRPFIELFVCLGLATTPALARPGASQDLGEKDWSAVSDMAALDGKIYVASAVNVWEVDKKGNARPVPVKHPDWGRTAAITALDGKLYCINEEMLWEVEPSGKVKNLGKEWYSVPGMAGLDGKLYIVSDEALYDVDKETGKYTKLSEDWYNVDGVMALDGKLYIVSRDTLYEVDKLGNRKELSRPWNDPNGVTVAGGKLYIFHHERADPARSKLINEAVLYEVDAGGKGTKLALPKGWDPSTGLSAMAALDGKLYMVMPGMSRSQLFTLEVQ